MFAILAAAALLAADNVTIPIDVHGMDRPAAHAALQAAAVDACRVLGDPDSPAYICVRQTTADAMRQFDELRARRPLLVADRH